MIKILANDGISDSGIELLKSNGFSVETEHVQQENLIKEINSKGYKVLLVRSATKVRKELINKCPGIEVIGRGGVGMDNIDVDYAKEKGIYVFNTPAASSVAVAEIVFAHLFGMVRFLFDSNRKMPMNGDTEFKLLKKSYSKGTELKGKTIGIIGFGRIGQEVAKRAIGIGMNVLAHDKKIKEANLTLDFFDGSKKTFTIETDTFKHVLSNSDFITLHIPKTGGKPIIDAEQIGLMKTGAGIINTARGGIINEDALMFAIDKKKLSYAGLDVYNDEPSPSIHLLMHNAISLSPHIGAATLEAQDRIGVELAEKIKKYFETK